MPITGADLGKIAKDSGQIKVIVIEADLKLRLTLETLVRKAHALKFVAAFASAEEALAQMSRLSPDVAVVNVMLPDLSGIACTAAIKRVLPQCQVLVIAAIMDVHMLVSALQAGAGGYLIKGTSYENILHAIQDVSCGGAPMNAVIARKLVESFHGTTPKEQKGMEKLTEREEEILRLLTNGHVTKEIGPVLNISYATVRFHIRNIYEKLNVNSRAQAVLKYRG